MSYFRLATAEAFEALDFGFMPPLVLSAGFLSTMFTFFFAAPMLVWLATVANSKLCRDSFQCSWSGFTITNMRVLPLPVRLSCRMRVN